MLPFRIIYLPTRPLSVALFINICTHIMPFNPRTCFRGRIHLLISSTANSWWIVKNLAPVHFANRVYPRLSAELHLMTPPVLPAPATINPERRGRPPSAHLLEFSGDGMLHKPLWAHTGKWRNETRVDPLVRHTFPTTRNSEIPATHSSEAARGRTKVSCGRGSRLISPSDNDIG